jgi:hypothetical protein
MEGRLRKNILVFSLYGIEKASINVGTTGGGACAR